MSVLLNPYVLTSGDVTAPTITSASAVYAADDAVLAHTLTANESVTWSTVGGVDQADFEISGSTLRWASNGTRDFDAPADDDANNTYLVTVRATDTATNTTDQNITVTVLGAYVFAGAMAVKSADQTAANYSTAAAVSFDSESFDTDGFHEGVTNPTRITVPASVNGRYGVLTFFHDLTSVASPSTCGSFFKKNGSESFDGNASQYSYISSTASWLTLTSQPILLATGDYFEVFLHSTDTSITVQSEDTTFSIEILW